MKKLLLSVLCALGLTASAQLVPNQVAGSKVLQSLPLKSTFRAGGQNGRAILNSSAIQLHNDTYSAGLSLFGNGTMGAQITFAQYIPSSLAKRFIGCKLNGMGGYMYGSLEGDVTFFVAGDPTDLENTTYTSVTQDYDDIKAAIYYLKEKYGGWIYSYYDEDFFYMFYNTNLSEYNELGEVVKDNDLVITEEMAENGFYIGYTSTTSTDEAMYYTDDANNSYAGYLSMLITKYGTQFTSAFYEIYGQGANASVTDYSDGYGFSDGSPVGAPEFCVYYDTDTAPAGTGYHDFDIQMGSMQNARGIQGDVVTLRPQFRNMGMNDITGATFRITTTDANGNTFSEDKAVTFTDAVKYGAKATVNLDREIAGCGRKGIDIAVVSLTGPTEYNYVSGSGWQSSNVQTGFDTYTDDNVTSTLAVLMDGDYTTPRKFVMETMLGAWNGYSPLAMIGMDKISEDYEDNVIPIGIHMGNTEQVDPYACGGEGNGYYRQLCQYIWDYGYMPYAFFNRTYSGGNPFVGTAGTDYGIVQDVEALIETDCEAKVEVGSTIDQTNGEISAEALMTFALPALGSDYGVAFVITEDELPITQLNNFSNNSAAVSGIQTQEVLDLVSQPSNWQTTTNFVARYISDEFAKASTLEGNVGIGKHMTYKATIRMSDFEYVDLEKCSVVALLFDITNGEIVNAAKAKLGANLDPEGISQVSQNAGSINAEAGKVILNGEGNAKIYNMAGQLVSNKALNGNTTISLPNGSYIVRIANGNDVIVKKVAL